MVLSKSLLHLFFSFLRLMVSDFKSRPHPFCNGTFAFAYTYISCLFGGRGLVLNTNTAAGYSIVYTRSYRHSDVMPEKSAEQLANARKVSRAVGNSNSR